MKEMFYSHAIREAMFEEMRRDPNVFVIGEDVAKLGGWFGVTQGLVDEFGSERVIDTPVEECGFAFLAVGAAVFGKRPIVDFGMGPLAAYAFDPIVNHAAKYHYMTGGSASVPVVFRMPQGPTGAGGQHSQIITGWYQNVPGLKIVAPSTPADAKGLLKAAIRDNNPVIFAEEMALYGTKGPVPEGEYLIPLGKANVVRAGKDVTVVANQLILMYASQAAEELAAEGISVELIDPRTFVPLDTKTIYESVRKTGKVIIVCEEPKFGSLGGQISAKIAEDCFDSLKAPIVILGGQDHALPWGFNEPDCSPSKDSIKAAIKEITNRKVAVPA